MSMSQNDVDAAARKVVEQKLARGISHIEVANILDGSPGWQQYTVAELGAVRDQVHAMFADYLTAIRPGAVA